MKIYISQEMGSIYHLDGAELCFTPLSSKSGVHDLENDGGVVDWEVVAGEKTADGQDITDLLNVIIKKLEK